MSEPVVAFKDLSEQEMNKLTAKAVVVGCDMVPAEMAGEVTEIVTMAVDKYVTVANYEAMSKMIKEALDKKYGPQWHCAIGEGFGFDVTYQQPNMIYLYYTKVGILLYKC
ncbi:dynein light chain type 1-domain-containing protein [Pelagophyceae sp. CCMP2097]|nr:dynein light chain type 1-domain-containing protein [Pelagophyceae sp. CCMP2097]